MTTQTWLITGGAGFLGGNFVLRQMRRDDLQIVNLDALTYAGNLDTLDSIEDHPGHVFVLGDIGDRNLLDYLLSRYQPDVIVNFAAESDVDRSVGSPEAFMQTNVLGAFQMLEATRHYWSSLPAEHAQAFRFIQVSADEVYGSLDSAAKFTETSHYRPNSPYAASKANADLFARAYYQTYGLPVITAVCSNIYGPYQFPQKFIPRMIQNALKGRALKLHDQGAHSRGWMYVEDYCRAIETIIGRGVPGEVYNIGGNDEKTDLEVANILCGLLDELLPESANRPHGRLIASGEEHPPGHDWRRAVDTSKIRKELGWEPKETFDTGLRKTLSWYLQNLEWTERVTDGSYREERLAV